ncbi:iron-sulfur cluster repair di-iron protein [Horticoccus sp. 23ND18S-11]|uniref:iron-sulfur cluster repair di-iron protein n=1 Tax=Horticoccus sp. 23ND18S-11 TaxID=3391832 RepID=UPI0039C9D22E
MPTLTCTPETTVGEIVAAQPRLARIFERVGIDYCCGGKRSLAQACAARKLDPATLLVLLEATADSADERPMADAAALSLTALADHIEGTHHAYLRAELPRLVEFADRVAAKHGERDARLVAIAATVRELAGEMFLHMMKEEEILFPMVRAIELGQRDAAGHCGSIAHPIRQMELEHDGAGAALARLRELTDGFTPNAEACNTHRALLAGLAELESDLHEHVHKENNILFPRALDRESRVLA